MTNTPPTSRQAALDEIVALADRYALSAAEIAAARANTDNHMHQQKSIMSRLFNYIGGILVFCGFAVFISMNWADFTSLFRVIITLGTGFCAFIVAVALWRRGQFPAAVAPLLLIAACFETGGLCVFLHEYGDGGHWRDAALFISGSLGFQFGMTYIAMRHGVLAFFALLFGGVFAVAGMDKLDIDDNVIGIAVGISYLCLATALSSTIIDRQSGFWHFVGSTLLLFAFYDAVDGTVYNIAFLGLCALLVYLSIVARSRTLLIVSTLAMIWYIGDYAFNVFANNGLFALALIVTGGIFMGLGAAAMKIDRHFIRQTS